MFYNNNSPYMYKYFPYKNNEILTSLGENKII